DQVPSTHSNEVRRTQPSADEMHGHGPTFFFSPPRCGEGSGVGVEGNGEYGATRLEPPPQPSPLRGEGWGAVAPSPIASPVSASAQVAGPTAMRGAISRAAGPPAARAAASATDGTPASAITRSERVAARIPAAARLPCGIKTRGTPIADAAAAIPGSPHL